MTFPANAKSAPIVGLDIIRFLAAVMVMWFHLAYMTWAGRSAQYRFAGGLFEDRNLSPYANWGWVGVEVFFVLSGFVIAFSAQGKSATAFARSRFLRLYPGAWVCCALIVAMCVALHLTATSPYAAKDLPLLFAKSVALWPVAPWLDGVFWTLAVELVFYGAIFAMLRFARFEHIGILLAAIGVASALAIFGSEMGTPIPLRARWAELLLLPHGVFFAIGGFLWIATQRRLYGVEIALIAIFAIAGLLEIIGWAEHLGVAALAPCMLWLVATFAIHFAAQHNERLIAALPQEAGSIARNLGLATYPLYLIHTAVGASTMRWVIMSGGNQHLALALGMAVAIVAALLISRYAEPGVRRATADLMTRLSPSPPPSPRHPQALN